MAEYGTKFDNKNLTQILNLTFDIYLTFVCACGTTSGCQVTLAINDVPLRHNDDDSVYGAGCKVLMPER